MKAIGLSLVAMLAVAGADLGAAAAAPKKRPAAKAAAAPAAAPAASSEELEKLKGDYKWGMSPAEVMEKVVDKVRSNFEERLKKTAQDPTRYDRVQKEMMAEIEKVRKHALVKFEGQKSGYDVSIIDQEFGHGVNESMLVAKEENATRYFFFAYDRLYKMFIAFDREMLQGKGFQEFGQLMQARFGKAREVTVDEKTKGGVRRKLDHFVWSSKSGDGLRLVDRSEFYHVYCLVLFDGSVEQRQLEARRANAKGERRDALVEAVTATGGPVDRDPNDNVVDRITGRNVRRPGDEPPPQNIQVPSPARAPTPAEVNRGDEDAPRPEKKGGRPAKARDIEL